MHIRTEGVPLHLKFLADDLIDAIKSGSSTTNVLTHSPTSFRRYVDAQIETMASIPQIIQHPVLLRLFSVLAVALGPLSEQDIQAITDITVFDLKVLPHSIARWFVITDAGSLNEYSFTHPLIAVEFRRALGRMAEDARSTLISYCRSWRRTASVYALRYYPEHLLEAQKLDLQSKDELYHLARNADFSALQAQEAVDLPLRTLQMALRGAMDTDDASGMAEFLLRHAFRVSAFGAESPIAVLNRSGLERAWTLISVFATKHAVLWALLLALLLNRSGRQAEAARWLERLKKQRIAELPLVETLIAAYLLAKLSNDNWPAVEQIYIRLLNDDRRRTLAVWLTQERLYFPATAVARSIRDEKICIETAVNTAESPNRLSKRVRPFTMRHCSNCALLSIPSRNGIAARP